MQIILLISFQVVSICLVSLAPYIKQSDRPVIAGHRGLSALFPENTLQSEQACMYQGADFIELDVVLSKDGVLIVSHDAYLSRVSNILDFPQFANRKVTRTFHDVQQLDWWISDFTVQELKTLRIKQALAPGRLTIFDNLFTFPIMQEIIDSVIAFNLLHAGARNPDGNLVGILFEAKDYQYHLNYTNTNIAQAVIQFLQQNQLSSIQQCILTAPIVLMSFDPESVQLFYNQSDLPRVQLIKKGRFTQTVEQISQYANILAAELSLLWNQDSQTPTDLNSHVKNNSMLIYGWVFREDEQISLSLFNTTRAQDMFRKAIYEMRLDGIITESPDIAQAYAQSYKRGSRVRNNSTHQIKNNHQLIIL